jgi:AraC-like DNA-binding protein
VLRFRRAVELLRRRGASTIGEVAAEAGFADHSHLVRECRTLAGCTPTELVTTEQDGEVTFVQDTREPAVVPSAHG